jgi:cleavage stimulation factor subunit 3
MKSLKDATKDETEAEEEWDGERREREREIQKEHEKEVNERVEIIRQKKNDELKSSISLTWIIYMRFTRRSQNIKAARLVFSKARKSALITNHVYTASALMEFYVNKDPTVAGKIFELGMKTFNIAQDKHAAVFICRYIDFLVCLNDDNNTRALFERALAAVPPERSQPIWQKYINYETQYGDLTNLHKIQQRRAQAFPQENLDLLESVQNVAEKWAW